jgi:DNA polymerase-3 subunit delta'
LNFHEIIGHKEIIKALSSSLTSGKVGHAYLFVGPEGVGKKTLARAFARRLFCREPDLSPDCECRQCRKLRENVHPDLIKVVPSGGSTVKIEQLRELQRQAYLSPVEGRYKIFFFPETEKLTDAAANSFLKILEETPPGVVFLFIAVRADYILPTIRSRCQVYNLFPVPAPEIAVWLEKRGIPAAEAERRAVDSHGSPGLALRETVEASVENVPGLTEVLGRDLIHLLKLANELDGKDRRQSLAMLRQWQSQARLGLLQAGQADRNASANLTAWIAMVERLGRAIVMVEQNVNVRLALEDFFITIKLMGSR